jgi:hypothetical protein
MATPAVRPFISRCARSRAEIFIWTDSPLVIPAAWPQALKRFCELAGRFL